ncbi:putative dynein heavy chain [Trypanosoma cruzi]|uniref:Putative dynein heavy chain n=1 Tax=Trypanosoma cruzi TaxID=5693 RepID=A0A2V2WQK5_TRYCR|nr:putative dynein heavy chain [Trypanosoma cruzi]
MGNEEMRTFRDRLTTVEDREWFDEQLQRQIEKHIKVPFTEIVPPETGTDGLLFVDFLDTKSDQLFYEEVKKPEKLVKVLEDKLVEYNNVSFHKMNIVMFAYAVEHICRIARVIRDPTDMCFFLVLEALEDSLFPVSLHSLNDFEVFQVENLEKLLHEHLA